jgi:hypothetical protein
LPDFENGQFVVTTDVSSKGIGAILSQIIPIETLILYKDRLIKKKLENLYAIRAELYQKVKVIIPQQIWNYYL